MHTAFSLPSRRVVTLLAGLAAFAALALVGASAAQHRADALHMGRQADGSFVVSSGQRVGAGTIAFDGRAVDLALHPTGSFFAVTAASRVFLSRPTGVIAGSEAKLAGGVAFHGVVWSPDGTKLYVSVSNGTVQELTLSGETLTRGRVFTPDNVKHNPRPGGMAITRDGKTLYVAECEWNAVEQIDLVSGAYVRSFPTQNLPFEVKLSRDEKTLIVSDWGGALPKRAKAADDDEGEGKFGVKSGNKVIVANRNGSAATGALELIDRATGATRRVSVGQHPSDLAVAAQSDLAYVANASSDTISVVDLTAGAVKRTIPLLASPTAPWGKIPSALALAPDEKTLFVCMGGDNALAEVDLVTGFVRGIWPAGYFPLAVAVSPDGKAAYVVNTKGNGSVRRTSPSGTLIAPSHAASAIPANVMNIAQDSGEHIRTAVPVGVPGNVHDFEGTVSVIDLTGDRVAATRRVAEDGGRNRPGDLLHPNLAVYNGTTIKHVLYIIKENRSYDEVFGDMPAGDGDPKLCDMGEQITPNAHKLVRDFTLFDNGYVSGTNSADGHAWTDQGVANDYIEHVYTDYRTYPDGEDDAMGIDPSGCLWDAALKKGKTVRVYGEASDYGEPETYITPPCNSWLDLYHDRLLAHHTIHNTTRLPSLKPLKNPNYLYWPLLQPDQSRADIFLKEYGEYSAADRVPDLMVLSLPCDHTEGAKPQYPRPKSMVADNDLALGRIVEAVSHSPQWKSTCILVIEDDAQAGLDHIDGHRTVFMAYSPYIKRGFVDSHFYSTVSMLHSIELMLGLDPMNRFDSSAPALSACFTDTPNAAPYVALPSNIPLDDMNPPATALRGKARYWADRTRALDWSEMDRADAITLSQILWHDARGLDTPYPNGGDPPGYGAIGVGLTRR